MKKVEKSIQNTSICVFNTRMPAAVMIFTMNIKMDNLARILHSFAVVTIKEQRTETILALKREKKAI